MSETATSHGPVYAHLDIEAALRSRPPEPRRWRWLAGLALPALGITGVLLFGGSSVPADDLGQRLSDRFGAPVSCDEGLDATVGATVTCVGHDADGTVHHLLVRTTAVQGSQVGFEAVPQD